MIEDPKAAADRQHALKHKNLALIREREFRARAHNAEVWLAVCMLATLLAVAVPIILLTAQVVGMKK